MCISRLYPEDLSSVDEAGEDQEKVRFIKLTLTKIRVDPKQSS